MYRVDVSASGAGPLGSATAWVLVGGVDTELADPRLDAALLRRLSEATGGDLLGADELAALPQRIRSSRAQLPLQSRDVWHSVWIFLLVIVLLSSEWSLRRAWGLR